MNKKAIIIISIIVLIIMAGTYFFRNTDTKQSESSQDTAQQVTSGKLVEIFYLPHPPAEAIVSEIETVLVEYPEFTIIKYDFTDPVNEQKMQTYGVTDHTPIAIFINGINTFDLEDRSISLVNFPRGDAFVPTLEGTWNYDDFSKVLIQYK